MPFNAGQRLRSSNLGQLALTARYEGASTQTITTATDTLVAFGTEKISSDYVTRTASGSGHFFTVNASGIWFVQFRVRWSTSGASATGQKHCHLRNSLSIWWDGHTSVASTTVPVTNQALIMGEYLDSGTEIYPEVYQDSGGDEDLDQNSFHTVPHIVLSLVLQS